MVATLAVSATTVAGTSTGLTPTMAVALTALAAGRLLLPPGTCPTGPVAATVPVRTVAAVGWRPVVGVAGMLVVVAVAVVGGTGGGAVAAVVAGASRQRIEARGG